MAGIAPGLDGVLMAHQQGQQRQMQEFGILAQLAQLRNSEEAAQQAREMRPLQLELLKSQIAAQNAQAPLKALELKQKTQQMGAQGMLSNLMLNGGYEGPTVAPTAVAQNDAEALRLVQEADARGQQLGVNVPNPQNVRALGAVAYPQEFGKSLFPKPMAPGAPVKVPDKNSPTGFSYVSREQAIGMSAPKPGDNSVTVNNYPADALVPGKTGANKIDEGLLDVGMRLQGLSAIERQFKPEYQQIGTRLNQAWNAGLDKMGVNLPEADKKQLIEFSQYKRNAIDMMNQYIKSITGAAMSEQEAQRILKGLPNPGQGLMDGDSPIEFKAKMDDAIKQSRMAEARFVYMKRKGMALGDVPLDQMPSLMNQRGGEIEATIRRMQPSMQDAEVRKMVRRNLAQEFGLSE